MPSGRLEELQEKIGVAFSSLDLLREALTHSSFANESPQLSARDNERLEYLGDAVLQLITAEYLFKLRPDAREGEMTQLRSTMVNTNTLASLAETLGLGDYLYLGKGIAKGGGRSLKSLLANAFEAVLGAVFLDAGYDAAYHYYLDRFRTLPEPVQDENYKGRLQQVVQERYGMTPYYDSAGARGGRQREYTAVVYAGAEPLGTGHGSTKQTAEQEAAKSALVELEQRAAAASGRAARRRERQPRPEPPPRAQAELEPPAMEPAPAEAAPAAPLPGQDAAGAAEPAARVPTRRTSSRRGGRRRERQAGQEPASPAEAQPDALAAGAFPEATQDESPPVPEGAQVGGEPPAAEGPPEAQRPRRRVRRSRRGDDRQTGDSQAGLSEVSVSELSGMPSG